MTCLGDRTCLVQTDPGEFLRDDCRLAVVAQKMVRIHAGHKQREYMMMKKAIRKGLYGSGTALRAIALVGAGLAATGVVSAPVHAQDFTNVTASGRVSGPNGEAIPNATVTVTSEQQGFSRSTTTSSSGAYDIPQLPSGTYTFSVAAEGFETYQETGISLTQGQAGNSFSLVAAGTAAPSEDGVIVVLGTRTRVVDFERTTTGAAIQIGELATRVPVARDVTSVVLLAPSTTQGDSAFGNLPNIAGSSVAENAYYVNGLNITQFRDGLGAVSVPFEFYETVEVKNGGFPAEFGRTTGGVINAITKSGSNEFHGGVLVNWEPDDLKSSARNTILSENSQEEADRINTSVYLSGPIWKDRLFFYGLYEFRNVTSTNTVTSRRRQCMDGTQNCATAQRLSDDFEIVGVRQDSSSTKSPFYALKLDAIPIDGHRLEGTYFNTSGVQNVDSYGYNVYDSLNPTSPYLGSGNPGQPGTGGYQGTSVFRYGGENYVGRYTGQFTDWLTLSAAYGVNEFRDTSGSTDDSQPFIFDARTGQSLGNSLNVIGQSYDEREFYRADVDVFVNLLGEHHFKAGYDRENLTTDTTTSYTGGQAITYFNSGPDGDNIVGEPNRDYLTSRTFVNGGVFESQNESFYIQDSWTLFDDRLTLQIGARNDRFENRNVAGETYYSSGDNWAPRLGFSADPFGDGRTKIYGSFGRYYLPVAANTNIRLAGAELDYTRYFYLNGVNADGTPNTGAPILTATGVVACPDTGVENCRINSDGEPTPTDATVAKNLQAQSMDEFIIGAERKFGERWSAGIYYTHRELTRALEDVAIDAAVNQYCLDNGIGVDPDTPDNEECSAIYSGFHQYVLVNPGNDSTITLSDVLPGETERRTIDFTAEQLGYPKATRDYDAVTFQFEREFDGVWSLQGSYTWSRLYGNYEGAVKSDNGQTDAGLTTDFDQPGLTNGTLGFSPNHRRHNFKLFGSYQVTDWLLVGANVQATSPRKFGCIGRIPSSVDFFAQFYGAAGFYCNVDENGEIITDERTGVNTNTAGELTPRGSVFESDWQIQSNLSFVFRLPTDDFTGDLRVDVFNIFNDQAALDFDETGTLGNGRPDFNYRQPTRYQAPRSVRLQLGLRF